MPKIINFHDIADPQWFEDCLEVITSMYKVVLLSEIKEFYNGKKVDPKSAHLTVDDGHISTYTIIYPLLKKYNLSASIFVSPKIIVNQDNFWYQECGDYEDAKLKVSISAITGIPIEKLNPFYAHSILKTFTNEQNWKIIKHYQETNNVLAKVCQYINAEQLLELDNSGIFEIGAHTMNHPILANESAQDSKIEIQDSVKELGKILGRNVTTFAYPNGSPILDFGKREMQSLQEVGVDHAFSFEFKNLSKNDNLLSIPRYGLYHGNKDFVRKKLKYGSLWEPVKKALFNNEDKHRLEIKKALAQ